MATTNNTVYDYDWTRYARGRPKCPESLGEQILDYRRSHGGAFDVSHDIGTGWGVVPERFLLPNFKHVYASDPIVKNFAPARHRLQAVEAAGRLTTMEADAETKWLPDSSVDLVTAFECLHWTDETLAMPCIAAQLKSGGTFAALHYNPFPVMLNGNEPAQQPGTHVAVSLPKAFEGMDNNVALPTNTWRPGVKRIHINTGVVGALARVHAAPDTSYQFGSSHTRDGRSLVVGPKDVCEDVTDVEGWVEEVDIEHLRDLIGSYQVELPIEGVEKEFQMLGEALKPTGGKVKISWIVELILAARK